MSMKVDLNSPLTDEERSYLLMRGRYAEIERVDALHGTQTPEFPTGDGTGPRMRSLLTAEDRAAERERLLARLREIDGAEGEGDDEEPDDEAPAPYESWTHRELDDELKRRGLPAGGSKQEKADRLYANDESGEQPPA